MAFNVPTSGQWIAFPMDLTKCATVEWSERYINYSAVYYTTRCFWGYLEKEAYLPTDLKPTKPIVKTGGAAVQYRLGVPEVGPAGTEKKLEVRGRRQ